MGRYLALGIACEIQFRKRDNVSVEKFNAIRGDLKKSIERYICAEHYHVTDGEDFVYYGIKEEVVNKNIYELIKEVQRIAPMEDFVYKMSYGSERYCISDGEYRVVYEQFNKENCPVELKYFDETDIYEDERDKENKCQKYQLLTPGGEIEMDRPYPPFNRWTIYDIGDLVEHAKGDTNYLLLWFDWNKSGAENEMTVVELLNKLLVHYFKNPLAKNLQFYITG